MTRDGKDCDQVRKLKKVVTAYKELAEANAPFMHSMATRECLDRAKMQQARARQNELQDELDSKARGIANKNELEKQRVALVKGRRNSQIEQKRAQRRERQAGMC